MDLRFQGKELVRAPMNEVWAFATDPRSVASCLPDVETVRVLGADAFDISVKVGVGFVRGRLNFSARLVPNAGAHHVAVVLTGGGMGSNLDLTAAANVVDNGDGTTTLDWLGTGTVKGGVASVGGPIIEGQARKLIAQTFVTMAAKLGARRT